jgi:hypothetical protein
MSASGCIQREPENHNPSNHTGRTDGGRFYPAVHDGGRGTYTLGVHHQAALKWDLSIMIGIANC